jgi:hypothetical protein
LARMAEQRGGAVSTVFAKQVLELAPVENGHIHEAMLSAVSKSSIADDYPPAAQLQAQFAGSRSGDPKASARGNGARSRGNKRYHVRFAINLPFAVKLNKGGTIRPGDEAGNKGRKVPGTKFPGPLYGPRLEEGRGVLMWKQGGQTMRARVRTVPAHNFWSAAAWMARTLASRLGLKER